jgi:tol-pal system protein YbgF
MRFCRLACLLLVASPFLAFGQKREFVDLQRDVAALQDQVRTLQRTVDERMAALTVLLQQTLEAANRTKENVAVLDSGVRERLKEQEKNFVQPVAGIGAKVDQMSSEFSFLRESLADVSGRMGKLEQRLVDVGNSVKVMQSPAPAPPSGPGTSGTAAGGPPPSATDLYAGAMRDKDSGNYDLALQEFNDYLRYFGNTETAPNAQFYIGEILYNKKDYENALKAFDAVLERFPENNKTLDSLYMKGQTLVKVDQRNEGVKAFREVVKRSPRSPLGQKATAQLKSMGLSASGPAPARRSRR